MLSYLDSNAIMALTFLLFHIKTRLQFHSPRPPPCEASLSKLLPLIKEKNIPSSFYPVPSSSLLPLVTIPTSTYLITHSTSTSFSSLPQISLSLFFVISHPRSQRPLILSHTPPPQPQISLFPSFVISQPGSQLPVRKISFISCV